MDRDADQNQLLPCFLLRRHPSLPPEAALLALPPDLLPLSASNPAAASDPLNKAKARATASA